MRNFFLDLFLTVTSLCRYILLLIGHRYPLLMSTDHRCPFTDHILLLTTIVSRYASHSLVFDRW